MEARSDSDSEGSNEKINRQLSSSALIDETLQVSVADLHKVVRLDYLSDDDTDLLRAAEETGPRVYTLKNHTNENLQFFVFGCQGDKGIENQRNVANYIRKFISERPELKPDFIILLGDNYYPVGVDSPNDKRFITQLYQMYDIPCFIVPGNHDFGYAKEEKINYMGVYTPAGKARGMHQVTHCYSLHDGDPAIPMSKPEFWHQSEIDFKLLPRAIMPSLFYSFIIGKFQLFFLDSNHLPDDYLSMIENPDKVDPNRNQAMWLMKTYHACINAGRTPLVFQHHPLKDISKRAIYGEGDAHLYFKDIERWKRLATHFGLDPNDYQFDELQLNIFKTLGIDAIHFCAHVHAKYNCVSNDMHQFVVGTGGGKLQHRVSFKDHRNIGFFLEELGFMAFSCNKNSPTHENMTIRTLGISGRELVLTPNQVRPITQFKHDELAALQKIVLDACESEAENLDKQITAADSSKKPVITNLPYWLAKTVDTVKQYTSNSGPSLKDVKWLHNIMAYFCQPTLEDLSAALYQLHEFMENLSEKGKGSLYEKINESIKASPYFGKTVQDLVDINVFRHAPH